MKTICKLAFLIAFSICFLGCDDKDKKENPVLSPEFLTLTSWTGTYTNDQFKTPVSMLFINDKRGRGQSVRFGEEYDFTFAYYIENNRLFKVTSYGSDLLDGDWILYQIEDNYLFFRLNYFGNSEGQTLELRKTD